MLFSLSPGGRGKKCRERESTVPPLAGGHCDVIIATERREKEVERGKKGGGGGGSLPFLRLQKGGGERKEQLKNRGILIAPAWLGRGGERAVQRGEKEGEEEAKNGAVCERSKLGGTKKRERFEQSLLFLSFCGNNNRAGGMEKGIL